MGHQLPIGAPLEATVVNRCPSAVPRRAVAAADPARATPFKLAAGRHAVVGGYINMALGDGSRCVQVRRPCVDAKQASSEPSVRRLA